MEQGAPSQLSRAYSVLLFSYGGLSFLLAAILKRVIPDLGVDLRPEMLCSVYFHFLFGVAAILIALLRWIKGASSVPASNALSVVLALEFPIGTALFIYWLIRVRPEEQSLLVVPKPVHWYTSGLFVAALGFSLSAVVFRTLISREGDEIFNLMAQIYIYAAVLLAAVGSIRCLNPRWGYYATFALNVALAPLIPAGTAASLLWFFGVRKHEQGIALA